MHVTITWTKLLLLSCLAFMAPAKPLFVGAIVVTMLDTVSGVWAARKRGDAITSAKLRRTISKAAVYTFTILAAYVAEKDLLGDLLPASKFVAGAIGICELKSVLENMTRALGQPIFTAVIGKLGSPNDPEAKQPDATK